MDLAMSPEQEELRHTALQFARGETAGIREDRSVSAGGSESENIWEKMVSMGWSGLFVPVSAGGLGATYLDAAALFEGLGHGPLLGPLFETAVMAPQILEALESRLRCLQLMADIAGGTATVATIMGVPDRLPCLSRSSEIRLRSHKGANILSGSTLLSRDIMDASHYVVLARTESSAHPVACIVVEASSSGVQRELVPGFGGEHVRVVFDDVDAGHNPVAMLSSYELARVTQSIIKSAVLLCSFQVGSCEAVLELSLDYTRGRKQFGRSIGAFQRVQDHVIDIANGMDSARWTTRYALAKLDDWSEAKNAIHVAKVVSSRAHVQSCTSAHEVHAGIGIDLGYPLALHTFMSRQLYSYLGEPTWHRRELARSLRLTI